MADSKLEQLEVAVSSVASKGNITTLGLASGAIEVNRGGAPTDLSKVRAGNTIVVEVTSVNLERLQAGNTVSGKFIRIKAQKSSAAPRGSDSRNS